MSNDNRTKIIPGFGERLRQIRKAHNVLQKELAKTLGVTASYISGLEKEKSGCSDLFLKAVELQYNVSERWLRYGEGEMFKVKQEGFLKEDEARLLKLYRGLKPEQKSRITAFAMDAFIAAQE